MGRPEPPVYVASNERGASAWMSDDRGRPELLMPRAPHVLPAPFTPPFGVPACPPSTTPVPTATVNPSPTPGVTPTKFPGPSPSNPSGSYQRWTYVLKFDLPSRISVMKNALGDSVKTITSYWPPLKAGQTSIGLLKVTKGSWTDPSLTVTTGFRQAVNTSSPSDPNYNDLGPACQADGTGSCNEFVYTLDYGEGNYGPDPGVPIDLYDENNHGRPLDGVGTWTENTPLNVIGSNAGLVNFGLVVFSDRTATQRGDPDSKSCDYTQTPNVGLTTSPSYNPIDTSNSGAVAALLREMALSRDGGIVVGGGTATNVALDWAQNELVNTFARDPRWFCLRPYGTILVTDGESNACNPEHLEWSGSANPCSTDPAVQGTVYRDYPPGKSEDIWKQKLLQPCAGITPGRQDALGNDDPIYPRTWVIGFGPNPSKCELNWTAFMGRTDANDPTGAAGYVWQNDPNFCLVWNSTTKKCTTRAPDATWQNNYNSSHDYAFSALRATEVAGAISKIVAATAKGDYTTSQGVSGGSVGNSQGGGTGVFLLPSADFPGWAGHLYKLDLSLDQYPKKLLPDGSANPYYDSANPYQETGSCSDGVSKTQSACLTAGVGHPTIIWTNLYRTDAADLLHGRDLDERQLYTWDPQNGNALVPLTASRLSDIQAIEAAVAGTTTINATVLDYLRGYDGTGTKTKRSAVLGPMINSTPAVVGSPAQYKQANYIPTHAAFEVTYANRQALIWIGSDDGMLHAFDYQDMTEVLAILPPTLIARQAVLYNNSLVPKDFSITGQPNILDYGTHLYGVASSFRFGDVAVPPPSSYDPAHPETWAPDYRTVGFLTTGPGGDLIAALDVTHPYPGKTSTGICPTPGTAPCNPGYVNGTDKNWGVFDGTQQNVPIKVLWSKTRGTGADQLSGLSGTWSVPAMGWAGPEKGPAVWTSLLGAGHDPASVAAAQQQEPVFMVDPLTGNLVKGASTNTQLVDAMPSTSYKPWVGHQTFADSVIFDAYASGFFSDNLVDVGLQADLNGRIWAVKATDVTSKKVLIDVTRKAGQSQPLYYPPAASGFEPGTGASGTHGCNVFAFASGTYYERSPAVTGPGIGTVGSDGTVYFMPSIYMASAPKSQVHAMSPTLDDSLLLRQQLSGYVCVLKDKDNNVIGTHTLSPNSQVTAAPFLLVDPKGISPSTGVFVVYDPDQGCNGETYVLVLNVPVDNTSCTPAPFSATGSTIETLDAGPGAASGVVIAGEKVIVVKSGVGEEQAGVFIPPNVKAAIGNPATPRPLWWREVK
jgi:hypothetical protein